MTILDPSFSLVPDDQTSPSWFLVVASEGPEAKRRFFEFFAARIRNKNTREAYFRAVRRFLKWCDDRRLNLDQIEPLVVAGYIEQLTQELAPPSVKQHLAAIRMLFNYLVTGQIVPFNPAASVRGPSYVVKRGKTPVLSADEARALLDSIDTQTLVGLRDRAIIGVMLYSFARVSAVIGMKVTDYYIQGKRSWLRFHEKGGKRHEVPAHHKAEEYLDAYIMAAGISEKTHDRLFLAARGKTGQLSPTAIQRWDVWRMINKRAKKAGIDTAVCCHSFRATGITVFLENGGSIEAAARIAAHESPRTTKLYDHTADTILIEDIERVRV